MNTPPNADKVHRAEQSHAALSERLEAIKATWNGRPEYPLVEAIMDSHKMVADALMNNGGVRANPVFMIMMKDYVMHMREFEYLLEEAVPLISVVDVLGGGHPDA